MAETVIIKGTWFLPSSIDKEVLGTLTYDPAKGIQLEIEAPFKDDENLFESKVAEADIILGESRNGEAVTLYSCFRTNFNLGNSYSATWYANQAFVGCHALSQDELCFTEIVLKVKPLFLWLDNSGIQITDWQTPHLTTAFSYAKPDDIYFPIDDKVSGEIKFYSSFSFPPSHAEVIKFTHWATIAIKTTDESELDATELWKYMQRFLNWLAVATGYPQDIEKVSYFFNELVERESQNARKTRQEVISYSKKQKVTKTPERPDQFLFTYPALKKYMPDMIIGWFALYGSIEIVLQILAENMGRDTAFSEFHFKDIIQALEAFHRKRIRNERMPKAEYKAYKKRILQQITNEADREFVKEQLNYGNEPKLRERLTELIERIDIPSLQLIVGDKQTFIKQVIDNRNYHTHLDSTGKENILTPTELYHLSEKALALLFTTIIGDILPDKDFIDQTLRTSRRWGFRTRERTTTD